MSIGDLISVPVFVQYKGTPWFHGCLIISRAFHGLPPGFEDMPIETWEEIVAVAKEVNSKSAF